MGLKRNRLVRLGLVYVALNMEQLVGSVDTITKLRVPYNSRRVFFFLLAGSGAVGL